MVFPFIKLTQVYNDDNAEKYERSIWLLPELVEHFMSFEIGYNGLTFVVKEDDKEIKRKIKQKMEDVEEDNIKGAKDDDD